MGYAPDGDVTTGNDSVNGNWTYTYDDFNRLASATQPGQGCAYVYDRFGNRWQQNVTQGTCPSPQFTFGANNRINTGPYTYDAAGNLTNDGVHAYAYDAENRITTVDGGTTATYVYDAEGRRVRKTTASGTVDFIFDLNDQIVSQVTATGAWTRGEVFAGSRHIATYVNGTGGTTLFAHGDWLGTERMRTNTTGASVETFTSLPFGDALSQVGSSPLHLTSKERDTESQLDYFGARYYNSAMGRFMVPDWAGKPTNVPYASFSNPQTLNLYSYVGNDPTNHADPDGHESPNSSTAGPCSGPDSCTKVIDDGIGTPQAAQAQNPNEWSLSWQVSASANFLGQELKGVYDTTLSPMVDAVEHPVQTVENAASNLVEGVKDVAKDPKGTLAGASEGAKDIAVQFGSQVASGNPRAIGQAGGLVIDAYIAVRGVQGKEIKIGDDLRIAPTGNRTGHPTGRFPHYHRRIVGPDGKTVPGGSMKWHRPWEP